MKKFVLAAFAAMVMLSVAQQKASAWCDFNFGVGFNVGFKCGKDKYSVAPGCLPGVGGRRGCDQPALTPPCEQGYPMMAPAMIDPQMTQQGFPNYVPQQKTQQGFPSYVPAQTTGNTFPSYMPQKLQPQAQQAQMPQQYFMPQIIYMQPIEPLNLQPVAPTVQQPFQQSNYQYSGNPDQGVAPAYWYDR